MVPHHTPLGKSLIFSLLKGNEFLAEEGRGQDRLERKPLGGSVTSVKQRKRLFRTHTFPYTSSGGFTESRGPCRTPAPRGRNGACRKECRGQSWVRAACNPRRQHPRNGACALQASEARFPAARRWRKWLEADRRGCLGFTPNIANPPSAAPP